MAAVIDARIAASTMPINIAKPNAGITSKNTIPRINLSRHLPIRKSALLFGVLQSASPGLHSLLDGSSPQSFTNFG
jgi:hypothetical protein